MNAGEKSAEGIVPGHSEGRPKRYERISKDRVLMGKVQKKIQLELAFMKEIRGEAPDALTKGTELSAANRTPESPATEHLMEEVCKGENVKKAYQRVKSNKGSPGIDGMTVLELGH